ncbi:MAG: IS6 family transposase [Nanoarchaeota archaeon]
MDCIYCNSLLTVRNGHNDKGVQRYKCKDCGRRFCEKGIFARHRYPLQIILDALFLYSQPISTRGVTKNLKHFRKIKPSHVAVYNWVVKFSPKLIELAHKKAIHFTNIFHVDEKFIHVRKSKDKHAYLWIVSDSKSNIIATHISFERDSANAKIVLRKAKERAGFSPELLISDGLQGYKSACSWVFGRKTRHVQAHFEAVNIIHKGKLMKISNNRAERINEFYALWLHSIRGFKRLDRANLLVEFFAIYYNYLMPHGVKEKVKVQWQKIPVIINS